MILTRPVHIVSPKKRRVTAVLDLSNQQSEPVKRLNVFEVKSIGDSMSNSSQEITKAFWVLGDHFSRMGGAARYFNMPESDIPLYVACYLAHKHSSLFDPHEYVNNQFIVAASHILKEVDSRLDKVIAKDKELASLIFEFVKYSNSKLKPQDCSDKWNQFVIWVNHSYTPV